MKKFINSQETITDEELVGFGLAYGDILTVDGHTVVSKDLEKADRVTIVTYGGSGHEPAQKGFVGRGMLDIQVDGDIFAAPNGAAVFEAMKLLNSKPENSVYIGDSDVDIETAKNAKLPCISVTWGFRDRNFLAGHGGKIFIDNPMEIFTKLQEIRR